MWIAAFFAAKYLIFTHWPAIAVGTAGAPPAQVAPQTHSHSEILTRAEEMLRQARLKFEERRYDESLASVKETARLLDDLAAKQKK